MARTSIKTSYQKGFKTTTLKTGEKVWKKGTGLMTAMQFVKVDFGQNEFIMSAWVQAGIGSVGGRRNGFDRGSCGITEKAANESTGRD